jgi:hypothetical protein
MSKLVGCENDEGTLNIHDETERCEMCKFLVGDGVRINRNSDLAGTIINVRDDGRGVPICTLRLHDKSAPTVGLYFARACELEYL